MYVRACVHACIVHVCVHACVCTEIHTLKMNGSRQLRIQLCEKQVYMHPPFLQVDGHVSLPW